jgi:hypothetical protein
MGGTAVGLELLQYGSVSNEILLKSAIDRAKFSPVDCALTIGCT